MSLNAFRRACVPRGNDRVPPALIREELREFPVLPAAVQGDDKKKKRGYCMTLNNYTDHEEAQMKTFFELNQVNVQYFCFGKEVAPTTLTPHLQGYVYLKNPKTIKEMQLMLSRHLGLPSRWALIVAKGTPKSNRDYCGKLNEAVPNAQFFEWGKTPRGQGKRTDLDDAADIISSGGSIRDVALEHPTSFIKFERGIRSLQQILHSTPRSEPTMAYWLHGPTGTGKTRTVYELFKDWDIGVYFKDAMTKWFCGMIEGQPMCIDDYRANGQLSFSMLLKLADRYPMNVETKGGVMNFNSKYLFVTSPHDIKTTFAHLEFLKEGDINQMLRRFTELDFNDPGIIPYLRLQIPPPPPVTRQTPPVIEEPIHPWMMDAPFDNLPPSRLEALGEPPTMIRQTNAPSPVSILEVLDQDEEYAQFPEGMDLSFLEDINPDMFDYETRARLSCISPDYSVRDDDDASLDISQEECRSDGGLDEDYVPTDDEDGWN